MNASASGCAHGAGTNYSQRVQQGHRQCHSKLLSNKSSTTSRIFLFRPVLLLSMTKLASSAPSMRFLNNIASEIDNLEMTEGPGRANFGPNVFQ